MPQIITISGMPGSGKSTVSSLLAKQLEYKYFSAGDVLRSVALSKGLSILEFGSAEAKKVNIDKAVADLVNQQYNFVVDSRLAFHFIPTSFKVQLIVDTIEAAKRIFTDPKRAKVENYQTLEKAVSSVKRRWESEILNWQIRYGVDISDSNNFDLIIDTTNKNLDVICRLINEAMTTLLEL